MQLTQAPTVTADAKVAKPRPPCLSGVALESFLPEHSGGLVRVLTCADSPRDFMTRDPFATRSEHSTAERE